MAILALTVGVTLGLNASAAGGELCLRVRNVDPFNDMTICLPTNP